MLKQFHIYSHEIREFLNDTAETEPEINAIRIRFEYIFYTRVSSKTSFLLAHRSLYIDYAVKIGRISVIGPLQNISVKYQSGILVLNF
ncbi:hypothetical protein Hanom_Chr02g00149271 [Helianthus anomalus]